MNGIPYDQKQSLQYTIQYGEKHELWKTWFFILIQIKSCECITTKYIPVVVVVIVCNNLDLQKCYLT